MKKTSVLPHCLALALMFISAATPLHAEDNTPKTEIKEESKPPVKKQPPKKKDSRAPGTFVPTDKVSADQAVAFPTDI
jgi:hypothetical protein